MSGANDYTRELFALLADTKTDAFLKRGEEVLHLIDKDITDLRQQSDIIRKVMAKQGTPAKAQQTYLPLSNEQKQAIREVALQLAKQNSNNQVSVAEIIRQLETRGIKLTVAKPTSVVGSMLSRMEGFNKMGGGIYKYLEVR
jgi:hypothetical protein